MADSIQNDPLGPDWPLGLILVATPGTPVNIMSLVDTTLANNANVAGTQQYSRASHRIVFTAQKKGVSHGTQNNTGNIYVLRAPVGGAGGRDDYGCYVTVIRPTDPPFVLSTSEPNQNTLNPYRYLIDADNASDGCFVTLVIS